MILSTQAIVLKTIKYGDSSLICRLFTKDQGKITIMAKGAWRPKNTSGAILEPMNHILLDYYHDSTIEKACIGLCNNDEKIIIKSKDEYTSPIQNVYKVGDNYIALTENSVYVLHSCIKTKKLNINL